MNNKARKLLVKARESMFEVNMYLARAFNKTKGEEAELIRDCMIEREDLEFLKACIFNPKNKCLQRR